jgi:hypothetical protein
MLNTYKHTHFRREKTTFKTTSDCLKAATLSDVI